MLLLSIRPLIKHHLVEVFKDKLLVNCISALYFSPAHCSEVGEQLFTLFGIQSVRLSCLENINWRSDARKIGFNTIPTGCAYADKASVSWPIFIARSTSSKDIKLAMHFIATCRNLRSHPPICTDLLLSCREIQLKALVVVFSQFVPHTNTIELYPSTTGLISKDVGGCGAKACEWD